MSKVLIDEQVLIDLANNIRTKTGSQETFKPGQMPTAVVEIPTADVSEYFNITINNSNSNRFLERYLVKKYPILKISGSTTDLSYVFYGAKNNITLSNDSDTSKVTNWDYAFNSYAGDTIPNMNTSSATSMNYTFGSISNITSIPNIDTSKVTSMNYIFGSCSKLLQFPNISFAKVTKLTGAFSNCSSLVNAPDINAPECTSFDSVFMNCTKLETVGDITIPKATTVYNLFSGARAITRVGLIDCSSIVDMRYILGANQYQSYPYIDYLGGFKDIGKAYLTTQSANYSYYTVDLGWVKYNTGGLDHDSCMRVINNLYDIATKGVQPQKLILGSQALSNLTSEEIAIATAKGWTVS